MSALHGDHHEDDDDDDGGAVVDNAMMMIMFIICASNQKHRVEVVLVRVGSSGRDFRAIQAAPSTVPSRYAACIHVETSTSTRLPALREASRKRAQKYMASKWNGARRVFGAPVTLHRAEAPRVRAALRLRLWFSEHIDDILLNPKP